MPTSETNWVDREEYTSDEPVTDILQLLVDVKAKLFYIPGPDTLKIVKRINRYLRDTYGSIQGPK